MAELLKATLQEVSADEAQSTIGDPVPVQFNPASLRLRLKNETEGGRSRGRQRRQHNGASSTVLSMDLVFDSADEGTEDTPVSVRSKTAIVEKYVLPKEDSSDAPPRLQFQWDQLIIAGIVESVDIDFDHFAENGAPLRAKVSLSIKEQEPKYTYVEGASGAASRGSDGASTAGSGSSDATEPGSGTNDTTNNGDNSDRSDTALEGETAADFLARQGLDPTAWRGLGVDLSAGVSLQAGIEVGFSASLNASVGVGVSVGVLADVGVSLEASLGIGASAVFSGTAQANASVAVSANSSGSATASAGTQTSVSTGSHLSNKKINADKAGLALSAAGGIQSAIETVKINETQAVASAALSAFSTVHSRHAVASTEGVSNMSSSRAISAGSAGGSTTSSTAVQSVSIPSPSGSTGHLQNQALPTADTRSTSYGYGVPLRALYPTAPITGAVRVCSVVASNVRSDGGPAFRQQTSTPPWVALPKQDKYRAAADLAQVRRQQKPCDYVYHPCDCD